MALLRLGADLSVRNNKQRYPLKRVPDDTILEVLDTHCIKSTPSIEQDGGSDNLNTDEELFQEDCSTRDDDDEEVYNEILMNYEPRHMTNIGKANVTFDYEILAPTRYCQTNNSNIQHNDEKVKQPEMSVLAKLAKSKSHKSVLRHPVIESFIWFKWNRAHVYYNREMRTDILMTCFLTQYMVTQFGGVEYNNSCRRVHDKYARSITSPSFAAPEWNDTSFCEYFETQKMSLRSTIDAKYGYLGAMTAANKMVHHLNNLNKFGTDEWISLCMYGRPAYAAFVVIAIMLVYWMSRDVRSMFYSPNPFKRVAKENERDIQFLPKIIPILGYIKDVAVIISFLIFSDEILWGAILVLFVSMSFREVIQIFVGYRTYLLKLKNWSDLLLIALIVVVLYIPNDWLHDPLIYSLSQHFESLCNGPVKSTAEQSSSITIKDPIAVKRGLAAFMIVLTWTRLLFQIAKHPGRRTKYLNKYIFMYRRVATSVMKLLFIYCFFVISFALGFYVMFHQDMGEARFQGGGSLSGYQFFDTPYESFAKTIAMFTGEVDFNNIPIGISHQRRHGNISSILGYLFLLCFIVMVVLVLMNLLNGLAVSDIAEIVAEAEIQHQISMINILKELEDMAISNRETLYSLSNRLSFLKPMLKVFDFEEGLKIFPSLNLNTPGLRRQKSVELPTFESAFRNVSIIDRPKMMVTSHDRECEDIFISEARRILLQNEKSLYLNKNDGKVEQSSNSFLLDSTQ